MSKTRQELLTQREVHRVGETVEWLRTPVLVFRRFGQTVEQLLGTETANWHTSEQVRIVLAGVIGDAGSLIRLAGEEGADQVFHVVLKLLVHRDAEVDGRLGLAVDLP